MLEIIKEREMLASGNRKFVRSTAIDATLGEDSNEPISCLSSKSERYTKRWVVGKCACPRVCIEILNRKLWQELNRRNYDTCNKKGGGGNKKEWPCESFRTYGT